LPLCKKSLEKSFQIIRLKLTNRLWGEKHI
jgi:hypothetical protein